MRRDTPTKSKRSRPRFKELRVNLGDLSAAADYLGIEVDSKSAYQSLLDRLLLSIPSTTTEQAIPDLNQLLAPLLQELAAIKQQVSAGQAGEELEQLRQQVEQQQQEIDRLHAQLKQANDRLAQIAAAAQGLAGVQSIPVTVTPSAHIPPTAPAIQQPQSQPPAPDPRPAPGRPSANKLSPSDRVPIAISALMHHNHNCHPNDRWFLSGNVIATAAGANPALVVTPWLQSHPAAVEQLDQHNTAIGLNARSNGKEKNRGQLKEIFNRFIEGKALEELKQIARQFEESQLPQAVF